MDNSIQISVMFGERVIVLSEVTGHPVFESIGTCSMKEYHRSTATMLMAQFSIHCRNINCESKPNRNFPLDNIVVSSSNRSFLHTTLFVLSSLLTSTCSRNDVYHQKIDIIG
jgi:hypothetical protein